MPNSSPDSLPLSLDQIRALLDAAWACRRSEPQECVRLSQLVLEQVTEVAERARATLCLGCGLLHQGEFSVAEPELRRALQLYVDLSDQESERASLNALGTVKVHQGRPVEALELFVQVKHLSVAMGQIRGEIEALNNIGGTYVFMGDHSNALQHQLRVLGLSRQHGLPYVERIALNNISMAYNGMGRHEDALEAALACLKVQAEAEPALDAMAFQNAGEAHFGLKQFPEAKAMYRKASERIDRTGDPSALANLQLFLGQVAQQQGDLDEARRLFEQGLETCLKVGHAYGQVTGLLHLAELLGEVGQVQEALSTLHRARTLAEAGQLRNELCKADLALSRHYRQAGRFSEALTHLEWHLQLKGELFSAESDQRLQSLRVQFELEQVERERQAAQHRSTELSALNARLEETNRDLRAAQAQSAVLLARLEQHANEDALTGLPNRRAFDAVLARLSPPQLISIVVCDIDHFKAVNDRFSHLIGDEVLRRVAALLQGQLRPGDLLARYGGEEFTLLLTDTSESGTLGLCGHLRRTIEDYDWSTVFSELRLTVSLGAAIVLLEPKTLLQDVIRVADDALYVAKNAGRNRVEVKLIAPLE